MKKSGILAIAMIVAAGISSVSAADINFDGGKGLSAGSLREMLDNSSGIESVEASRPELVPVMEARNSGDALFMNEQACSILDANFLKQPAKEEAVEMLKPCLAAISGKYGAALRLVPGDKGLNLLVGDAKNPGKDLQAALRVELKTKTDGRFFGRKVALFIPSGRASANKGWVDDFNTVVEYIEDETAIDGAADGAAVGALVGAGSPAAIVVGAVIGAVADALND